MFISYKFGSIMKDVNRNKIDELFKAGLNQEEDPVIFSESGWSELEHRLDLYEKRERPLYWLKPLAGVAALFLLVFSIWMIWPVKQKTFTPKTASQQEEQEVQHEQKQVLSPSQDLKTSREPGQELSSLQAPNEPVQGETPKKHYKSDTPVKANQGENSAVLTDRKTMETLPESVDIAVNRPVYRTDSVKPDNQRASAEKQDQVQSMPDFTEPIDLPERKHSKIALSLLVAPAYNGADNLNKGQIGSDIGLLVTLGVTKKWSLSTGAVYAKKLYETDYSYASYTQMVDADCRVLDIPVNVNYTLINKGRTRISFGTGISSYIMLKEDYRFNSSSREDIHLVNENQHWLSVLNLQAGYERKLSSKISVNVQPYLKVPLTDIGYYKIRLQSLGLAVGASWSFNR